jgi:signal transduction histidine kinase
VVNAAVHGGRKVDVTAAPVGHEAHIAVHDDGPGIDPADSERIFDRFYKGDSSRAHGGSGLGLAIAREHARAQGGDIEVDPGAGSGATFTVRLPLADDGLVLRASRGGAVTGS